MARDVARDIVLLARAAHASDAARAAAAKADRLAIAKAHLWVGVQVLTNGNWTWTGRVYMVDGDWIVTAKDGAALYKWRGPFERLVEMLSMSVPSLEDSAQVVTSFGWSQWMSRKTAITSITMALNHLREIEVYALPP